MFCISVTYSKNNDEQEEDVVCKQTYKKASGNVLTLEKTLDIGTSRKELTKYKFHHSAGGNTI